VVAEVATTETFFAVLLLPFLGSARASTGSGGFLGSIEAAGNGGFRGSAATVRLEDAKNVRARREAGKNALFTNAAFSNSGPPGCRWPDSFFKRNRATRDAVLMSLHEPFVAPLAFWIADGTVRDVVASSRRWVGKCLLLSSLAREGNTELVSFKSMGFARCRDRRDEVPFGVASFDEVPTVWSSERPRA
jgi:hypothetical protein